MARTIEFHLRSRIVAGPGARSSAADALGRLGVRRVAVYSDEGLRAAGVLDMALKALEAPGLEIAEVFTGVLQDAREGIVNAAAARARALGVDGVVAVGGGSVLDSAKGINFLLSTGRERIGETMMGAIGMVPDAGPLRPFLAMPTTAGTGSEASPAAVFLNEETRVKGTWIHPWCASDVAILDAELTAGLPPRITAFTGMDALTHAVEGLTAKTANVFTQGLALQAIRLIFANLPLAVRRGDDLAARQSLLLASTLAIAAYSFSPGGAVHALAHALGGWFGVPHGLANSLLLPHVLEFNRETLKEKAGLLAGAIDPKAAALSGDEAARFAAERIRALQAEVGLPLRIRDACAATEADLPKMVEHAMGDMLMGLNPRRAGPEDALALYRAAL